MIATPGLKASPPRTPLFEPPHFFADTLRYGVAMVLVASAFGGVAAAIGHVPVHPEASEVDNALLVDLPPAEASSQPAREAEDVPEAAPAAAAPPQPVVEAPKPPETPTPETKSEPKEEPPPAPKPDAVLERKAEPPKPTLAPPPAAAQAAQAPAETGARADVDDSSGDAGTPHVSARKISLWQKALMRRLEAAKRTHRRAIVAAGTVKVAFEIDRQGTVRMARVTASSGSPALDGAAVSLVRDASPFPAPPAGAGEQDMSFIVPIQFKR